MVKRWFYKANPPWAAGERERYLRRWREEDRSIRHRKTVDDARARSAIATVAASDGLGYRDNILHRAARHVNLWAGMSEIAAEIRDDYSYHRIIGPFLRGEIK